MWSKCPWLILYSCICRFGGRPRHHMQHSIAMILRPGSSSNLFLELLQHLLQSSQNVLCTSMQFLDKHMPACWLLQVSRQAYDCKPNLKALKLPWTNPFSRTNALLQCVIPLGWYIVRQLPAASCQNISSTESLPPAAGLA